MERLKRHSEFTAVLRRRKRVSSHDIVLHLLTGQEAQRNRSVSSCAVQNPTDERRIGLAVSKIVGNAVKRNAVKRRFRVLAARYEAILPASCDIVIRAKPSAAHASFGSLEKQISHLFRDVALRDNQQQSENSANHDSHEYKDAAQQSAKEGSGGEHV